MLHHVQLLFHYLTTIPKDNSITETAALEQFVPDVGALQDIPGQLVRLSKAQGRLEVEEWQDLLHQLGRLPELLFDLSVFARHLGALALVRAEQWLLAH